MERLRAVLAEQAELIRTIPLRQEVRTALLEGHDRIYRELLRVVQVQLDAVDALERECRQAESLVY